MQFVLGVAFLGIIAPIVVIPRFPGTAGGMGDCLLPTAHCLPSKMVPQRGLGGEIAAHAMDSRSWRRGGRAEIQLRR